MGTTNKTEVTDEFNWRFTIEPFDGNFKVVIEPQDNQFEFGPPTNYLVNYTKNSFGITYLDGPQLPNNIYNMVRVWSQIWLDGWHSEVFRDGLSTPNNYFWSKYFDME